MLVRENEKQQHDDSETRGNGRGGTEQNARYDGQWLH
jgi:hypothetical protein